MFDHWRMEVDRENKWGNASFFLLPHRCRVWTQPKTPNRHLSHLSPVLPRTFFVFIFCFSVHNISVTVFLQRLSKQFHTSVIAQPKWQQRALILFLPTRNCKQIVPGYFTVHIKASKGLSLILFLFWNQLLRLFFTHSSKMREQSAGPDRDSSLKPIHMSSPVTWPGSRRGHGSAAAMRRLRRIIGQRRHRDGRS